MLLPDSQIFTEMANFRESLKSVRKNDDFFRTTRGRRRAVQQDQMEKFETYAHAEYKRKSGVNETRVPTNSVKFRVKNIGYNMAEIYQ